MTLHKVTHRSTFLDPLELGKLLVRIDDYGQGRGYFVRYAMQIMPYIFVRTNELINARWEQINFETCEWRYTVSKTNTLQEMCIHGFRATARALLDEVLRERYDLQDTSLPMPCATPMVAPITARSILRNAGA